MDASFCVQALDDALGWRAPEILNTDQGSQFTSEAFADRVLGAGVRFSMDGRGRFLDNIFIERLWRSLKYEAVYLYELRDGPDAQRIIGSWIDFYNKYDSMIANIVPFGPIVFRKACNYNVIRRILLPVMSQPTLWGHASRVPGRSWRGAVPPLTPPTATAHHGRWTRAGGSPPFRLASAS